MFLNRFRFFFMSLCLSLFLCSLTVYSQGFAQGSSDQAIAVLDVKNSAQLSTFEITVLTNEVRGWRLG